MPYPLGQQPFLINYLSRADSAPDTQHYPPARDPQLKPPPCTSRKKKRSISTHNISTSTASTPQPPPEPQLRPPSCPPQLPTKGRHPLASPSQRPSFVSHQSPRPPPYQALASVKARHPLALDSFSSLGTWPALPAGKKMQDQECWWEESNLTVMKGSNDMAHRFVATPTTTTKNSHCH